ncbi:PREDICTED: peptidyl-prolyl cis-trans isomerase FKBP20-2, chloroplastic isoform X2 [Nelumbo nucifera]|uniref:peptidylprolyl isomerase n=1 Tax=Nelumbo nucifera TaxID=4432 RepID=A0A1U8B763_NELNU|nr:PREDICTED: peptidyl-prolyl cis-trans isomerase FKBP20-2, chloroplastic isoform X2 [Nelumbo nucifera]
MQMLSTTLLFHSPAFICRPLLPNLAVRTFNIRKKNMLLCCSKPKDEKEWHTLGLFDEDNLRRRCFLFILVSSSIFPATAFGKTKSPYDERRLLEQNRRIQASNNAPNDFPNFIRKGFEVKVVTSDDYIKCDSGLIYLDIEVGKGECPKAGQQVTFHYVGYNESGRRIDSTYLQGAPAKIRMATNSLVPGFEEGIRDMRPGGKRRIIIPPELGPPVGPSTFFSSKQFEVFDVELLSVKDCRRRTIGFYSDVVCD